MAKNKTPMNLAIAEAHKAFALDEIPVGAVITRDNYIVTAAHNKTHSVLDPIGHAEIRAIRAACKILQSERLTDCDLYVTLEPCAMCAAAISFTRIRRLYYGAQNPKWGAIENGPHFFSQRTCHHVPEVYSAMTEVECAMLLKNFFLRNVENKAHC